jgi:hypothetical protein
MPLNTVQLHLKSILDQLPLPGGIGILQAFIQPLVVDTDAEDPVAYIWGSHGNESRKAPSGSKPRARPGNLASGGNKQLTHQVDIWLVYFESNEDPNGDSAFPSVIDAVMACLRNTELLDAVTIHAVDPVTGQLSDLLAIGEDMDWDYAGVRVTADQRMFRYDAQITCEVVEVIQA